MVALVKQPNMWNEPVQVKRGDIFQLGRHRLMVGDATNAEDVACLMQGKKADMMFTDPPYGVGYTGGHFHSGNVTIKRERERLANDGNSNIYADFLPTVLPYIDGPCYMWFSDSRVREVYNALYVNKCDIHAMIIWHKINAKYAAINAQYKQRHEPCLYFKPKKSTLRWIGPTNERTIWEMKRDAMNVYHPTQKPIALALRAINNHNAEIILDVFGGSGSTLIACEQAHKTCYMMELSPEYCASIIERWQNVTGQKAERVEVAV